MKRMVELIRRVSERYPDDDFFSDLPAMLAASPQARASYQAYDDALSTLDPASWETLSTKAISHFQDHRTGQLKQGFFNQLNDAFAYQFLASHGFFNIRVLQETGQRIPDISYMREAELCHCEVKTIGISDDEIARREKEEVFSSSIYRELSPEFLSKLTNTIEHAWQQITAQGSSGLVYVVLHFDDFTKTYWDKYQDQLTQYLRATDGQVVFRVGIFGHQHIRHD